jgi:hypothetical protein
MEAMAPLRVLKQSTHPRSGCLALFEAAVAQLAWHGCWHCAKT